MEDVRQVYLQILSLTVIQQEFEQGLIQSDAYELTLKAYDDSLAETRSQIRDDAAHTLQNGVLRG